MITHIPRSTNDDGGDAVSKCTADTNAINTLSTTAVGYAIAMYDFDATQDNQISLRMGDRLTVHLQEDSGWWHGANDRGQLGWFPASFVEMDAHSLVVDGDGNGDGDAGKRPQSIASATGTAAATATANGGTLTSHPDWVAYTSDDGQTYFVNIMTQESSWELPSAAAGQDVTAPPVLDQPPELDPPEDLLPPPLPIASRSATGSPTYLEAEHSFDSGVDDHVIVSRSFLSPLLKKRSSGGGFGVAGSTSTTSADKPTIKLHHTTAKPPVPVLGNFTFEDKDAVPQMEDGRYGYANNFWSDKGLQSGFDRLVLKHRNGKEVCKDVAHFMSERARIEEQYAKSLLELSKSVLGNQEAGTAKTAWNQLKFDAESQAKSRLVFAEQVHKDIHMSVMAFKDGQKKMRKDYEATMASDRRKLVEKFRKAQRLHAIYINRARDAEAADALVARGQLDTMSKRDFAKVEENARRERKRASIAAFDYRQAVEDYEQCRSQWEDDMTACSMEFQQAEEERIDYLRDILQKYLVIQKRVNDACKESSEMVENSFNAVSKEVDIELFVKSHFTGSAKPQALKFEPYLNYV